MFNKSNWHKDSDYMATASSVLTIFNYKISIDLTRENKQKKPRYEHRNAAFLVLDQRDSNP